MATSVYRCLHNRPPAPLPAFAQSPWERAADNLAATFTGRLALVAIVIGGLMFMFREGGAKRQISGKLDGERFENLDLKAQILEKLGRPEAAEVKTKALKLKQAGGR